MKKILLVIVCLMFSTLANFAEDIDVEEAYRNTPVPTLKYVHDIDPGENFDTHTSTWSPYPLFRLTTTLYFKTIAIQPGYYLLTPREQDGHWYMLFKEAGRVKYIVPIYKTDIVSEKFYDENLEKRKLSKAQNIQVKWLNFVGNTFKSSKRKPEALNYLDVTDLDNNFISLILYWGNRKYYTVLRTIQM